MMRVISILILFIFVRGAFSQGVNDCLSENLPLQHIYRQCSNAGSSINICKEKKSFESTVECLKNQKKARTIPVDKCKESVDDIISTCEGYIQSRKLDTKQNKVMELYLHLRNISNKKVEGFVLVNHKDVEKYSIAKKEFFKFLRFVYISTVLKYPLYVDEFIKLNSSLQSEQVEKNKVIVEEELALLRGNKIQVIIQEYHELKRSTKKTFQDTSLYGPYGILFSEELDGFDELLKPYSRSSPKNKCRSCRFSQYSRRFVFK
jgi:ribosomal protein S8